MTDIEHSMIVFALITLFVLAIVVWLYAVASVLSKEKHCDKDAPHKDDDHFYHDYWGGM